MSETVNTAGAVAEEIYQRMLRISLTNGYETDIGQLVYEGKIKVADEDVPPKSQASTGGCISIIEGVDTVDDRPGRIPNALITCRFALIAYIWCDPTRPNIAAHAAIRDLKRSIFANDDATFGGKVRLVKYLGKDIGPRADGVKLVIAMIEISAEFVEKLSTP